MEIVESTLDVPLSDFLSRPLFCFLSTRAADGSPRVTPLWFRWEDDAVWIIGNDEKTYPDRLRRDSRCDLAIIDFDRSTGRVQHVGMRGTGSVEPLDPDLAVRLLTEYLGSDRDSWDTEFFGDPYEWDDRMVLLRIDPETVVARDQSYVAPPALE